MFVKFINEFDTYDKSSYCNTNIYVTELCYDNGNGKTYYDIRYEYECNNPKVHPFYKQEDNAAGVIIYKNKMTEMMLRFLLATDEELEQNSGLSTAQGYRINIMHSLANLWD